MGFFFRKSVKFGPIRFNFSKSGIGVSAGVKGARVSTGPRGTYVHAGTNGFYYRQKVGGQGSQTPRGYNQNDSNEYNAAPLYESAYKIQTADVTRLVDTSSRKLLDQINTAAKETRIAPFAALTTVSIAIFAFVIVLYALNWLGVAGRVTGISSILAASVVVFVGAYFSWKIHKGDELKRSTPLFYELEKDASTKFTKVQRGLEILSNSSRMWRIQTEQHTWDRKRNAGASSLITRLPLYSRREQPPYIATNVEVWSIKLNDQSLYFLPDYIFIRQNGIYGAASYESLQVDFSPTRFIEEQGVPPDSLVVDTTWKFVNKNGGPDRRFSNNRQLPIVQYGFLQFQTRSGMNLHVNVSNLQAAKNFAYIFTQISTASENYRERTNTGNANNYVRGDESLRSAYELLGISMEASSEQIVAAYRQMAKMYHPDRLAHLAPEFVEMAEERMKEINIAYETLKKVVRA